jgi:hypothetical protein
MGERWRGRGTSESDDIYGVKGPPVFFPEAGEVLFQSLVVGVGGSLAKMIITVRGRSIVSAANP